MKVKSESDVAQSYRATPWTAAHQATLSMGFSRQEYGRRLPLPSPMVYWQTIKSDSYGEGKGTPLQYSCPENSMDGGAWWAAIHGVAEGRTRLSNFTLTFYFRALEKEMATHSSILARKIPWTEEPGGLESIGSQRVRQD